MLQFWWHRHSTDLLRKLHISPIMSLEVAHHTNFRKSCNRIGLFVWRVRHFAAVERESLHCSSLLCFFTLFTLQSKRSQLFTNYLRTYHVPLPGHYHIVLWDQTRFAFSCRFYCRAHSVDADFWCQPSIHQLCFISPYIN